MINLDRLKSTLLTSGLQQKDQPLYQVINQLIDALREAIGLIGSGSGGGGGGTVINQITNLFQSGIAGENGSDGDMGSPGVPGATGATGRDGQPGIPGNDGLDGNDCYYLIGSGGSSSSSVDHVVMSDGALPIPSPVDDGFGNFVYIAYTP